MRATDLVEVVGYSHWASYLINNDDSGLDADKLAECTAWLQANNVRPIDCLTASDESEFAYPDGGDFLKGDCLTYTFRAR